jgi:hypothetical protein
MEFKKFVKDKIIHIIGIIIFLISLGLTITFIILFVKTNKKLTNAELKDKDKLRKKRDFYLTSFILTMVFGVISSLLISLSIALGR